MTNIHLIGVHNSRWAEYGQKTVLEMVAKIRERARKDIADAQAILAAADEDFTVSTYIGVHVQRKRVVLQHGWVVDSLLKG